MVKPPGERTHWADLLQALQDAGLGRRLRGAAWHDLCAPNALRLKWVLVRERFSCVLCMPQHM